MVSDSFVGSLCFFIFELVRINDLVECGISNMIVVDGLVDFNSLAKIEHYSGKLDLRFINNK